MNSYPMVLLISPAIEYTFRLAQSSLLFLFSFVLFILGILSGRHYRSQPHHLALSRFAPIADQPLDPKYSRPQSLLVSQQQISGHRFGWFREELYHVPLEVGLIPMVRKRAARYKGKTLGALLLLHGFAQNRTCWDLEGRSFVNYLAEAGYDVFFLDLRGSRQSRKLGALAPTGIHEHIEIDVRQALKLIIQVSSHKKVYLVGHSMGGAISCAAAARFTDQVGGVIHLAGVYGFNQNQNVLWKPFLKLDRFIRNNLWFLPKNLLLPTREIGHVLNLLRYVMNTPLSFVLPATIMVSGSIEMSLLARYIYESFEPASLGVLQGLTDITHGRPLCDENGKSYFEQFEKLQLPLLVICSDQDNLVSVPDSLQCFESSSSRDKVKLVYVAEESAEVTAYGHCDIVIGKHAVVHVWEKIRIWLDQRRKLGISGFEEENGYILPKIRSSDLLAPSPSSDLFFSPSMEQMVS